MQDPEMSKAGMPDEAHTDDATDQVGAEDPKGPTLSRLDRLKLKIRKLQSRKPDIYPMF